MLIKFIEPDFQFADERGSLTQLVHDGWKQVNYITSVAGAVRGDHFHKENKEAFFVAEGAFKLDVEHSQTHEKETYQIKKGDFFVVYPHVLHSFTYTEPTVLISFYDNGVERSDGTKDIFK